MTTIASIQLNSRDNLSENLKKIKALTREAAGQNAELICLPENALLMAENSQAFYDTLAGPKREEALQQLQTLTRELQIWLLIGSLPLPDGAGKLFNRSLLLNPQGEIAAHYDKIHLCDITLPNGQSLKESARYNHGSNAVIATTPLGNIGMTVCYDLRFPHLFHALAKAGAELITVPSAFTPITGAAHWEVLLRARAIETGCFIIAPAQTGYYGNRGSYGHSMIINPWGEIIAKMAEEEGIITTTINRDDIQQMRQKIPSLQHQREFTPISEQ